MTPKLTLRVKVMVKGQGHEVKKKLFQVPFDHLSGNLLGQGSHGSRSKVNLEGQGQGHQVKNVISGPI